MNKKFCNKSSNERLKIEFEKKNQISDWYYWKWKVTVNQEKSLIYYWLLW